MGKAFRKGRSIRHAADLFKADVLTLLICSAALVGNLLRTLRDNIVSPIQSVLRGLLPTTTKHMRLKKQNVGKKRTVLHLCHTHWWLLPKIHGKRNSNCTQIKKGVPGSRISNFELAVQDIVEEAVTRMWTQHDVLATRRLNTQFTNIKNSVNKLIRTDKNKKATNGITFHLQDIKYHYNEIIKRF